MRKFVVILIIVLLYSVACKKEDFLWNLVRSNNLDTSGDNRLMQTITDIDGNKYITNIIGTQTWTNKNLNVSRYRNGDSIPQVQDPIQWGNLTTGAWCYYENKTANGTIYGKLYNWYAINDPRRLAPTGYHIPTIEEWKTLINYCGGIESGAFNIETSSQGFKHEGKSYFGFAGLGGGLRLNNFGTYLFIHIGKGDQWWSCSEPSMSPVNHDALSHSGFVSHKGCGLSVRCIKD